MFVVRSRPVTAPNPIPFHSAKIKIGSFFGGHWPLLFPDAQRQSSTVEVSVTMPESLRFGGGLDNM
jgi:hypothetical protein